LFTDTFVLILKGLYFQNQERLHKTKEENIIVRMIINFFLETNTKKEWSTKNYKKKKKKKKEKYYFHLRYTFYLFLLFV